MAPCPACHGSGHSGIGDEPCPLCDGSGHDHMLPPCPVCDGTGKLLGDICPLCHGCGHEPEHDESEQEQHENVEVNQTPEHVEPAICAATARESDVARAARMTDAQAEITKREEETLAAKDAELERAAKLKVVECQAAAKAQNETETAALATDAAAKVAKTAHADAGRETESKLTAGTYVVGQRVKCRDERHEWKLGTVDSLEPLMVTKDGWDEAFEWEQVRVPSKESQEQIQTLPRANEPEGEDADATPRTPNSTMRAADRSQSPSRGPGGTSRSAPKNNVPDAETDDDDDDLLCCFADCCAQRAKAKS